MTAVEKLIAEIEQELQDRQGCNGALNSGVVLGLTNSKNIAYKYLEMEKAQMIDFALFRDDYFEKANTLEEFTIPNEKLIRLFKHETFKSE